MAPGLAATVEVVEVGAGGAGFGCNASATIWRTFFAFQFAGSISGGVNCRLRIVAAPPWALYRSTRSANSLSRLRGRSVCTALPNASSNDGRPVASARGVADSEIAASTQRCRAMRL